MSNNAFILAGIISVLTFIVIMFYAPDKEGYKKGVLDYHNKKVFIKNGEVHPIEELENLAKYKIGDTLIYVNLKGEAHPFVVAEIEWDNTKGEVFYSPIEDEYQFYNEDRLIFKNVNQ